MQLINFLDFLNCEVTTSFYVVVCREVLFIHNAPSIRYFQEAAELASFCTQEASAPENSVHRQVRSEEREESGYQAGQCCHHSGR